MSYRTDRFVALPRIDGDAFLYERWTTSRAALPLTVFVDGGLRPNDLNAQLTNEIGSRPIHVLAVTHGDDDHTRGAQCILESDRVVRQLWLPATLEPVVNVLMTEPDRLVELVTSAVLEKPEGIGEILRRIRGRDRRDNFLGSMAVPSAEQVEGNDFTVDGHGELELDRLLREVASADAVHTPPQVSAQERRLARAHSGLAERRALWYNAVTKIECMLQDLPARELQQLELSKGDVRNLANGARRIAILANLAVARSGACRIRWFDVGRFLDGSPPSGGLPGTLRPLNAIEVNDLGARRLPALLGFAEESEELRAVARLALAFLSPSNAYGVVYEAPMNARHSGVIFSGDADFFAPRGHTRSGLWPAPLSAMIAAPGTTARVAHTALDAHERGDEDARSVLPTWGPNIRMFFTAPHHGSPSNDRAYFALGHWFPAGSYGLIRGTSSRVRKISECLQALPFESTCDGQWNRGRSERVGIVSR